jgi:hypothetical protein
MSMTAFKKLNLPLPEEMHKALFAESKHAGIPATRLARSAIQAWLDQQRQERRKEEIHKFAMKNAGNDLDLDQYLEAAATDELILAYEEQE